MVGFSDHDLKVIQDSGILGMVVAVGKISAF